MFEWFKNKPIREESKMKSHLTRRERLQAILISFKTGKITIEQTVNLIDVWRLCKRNE